MSCEWSLTWVSQKCLWLCVYFCGIDLCGQRHLLSHGKHWITEGYCYRYLGYSMTPFQFKNPSQSFKNIHMLFNTKCPQNDVIILWYFMPKWTWSSYTFITMHAKDTFAKYVPGLSPYLIKLAKKLTILHVFLFFFTCKFK